MSNGISGVGGFGTYTIFNSALQYLLGIGRRNNAEEQQRLNENFELQLAKAKEEFSDEMEAQKMALTRAKMQLARQYKAIETQDRLALSQKRPQLLKYLREDLPIDPSMLKRLTQVAEESKEMEANGLIAPLNVLLLYPIREVGQSFVNESLNEYYSKFGSITLLDWTNRQAAGNSSLYNLNVIMRDMPTLVLSPRYVEDERKIYFSAALWDSDSERHPYIRPLFAMDFDHKLLVGENGKLSLPGRKMLDEKLLFATTIVSGCARDSYMLMTHGLPPTLPDVIKSDDWMQGKLLEADSEEIASFLLNEYQSNVIALNSSAKENCTSLKELVQIADSSLASIKSIVSRQITN